MFIVSMASRWVAGHDRSGLGWSSGSTSSAFAGDVGRGCRIVMKRGCFRVSPLGTDVMGVATCLCGSVGRCVSSADTSLSLSLSLSTPACSTLGLAAPSQVAVPLGRYGARTPCCAIGDDRRPFVRGLFERRCRPPHRVVAAFEEVPSRDPALRAVCPRLKIFRSSIGMRAGSVAARRGPAPEPGSRRCLCVVCVPRNRGVLLPSVVSEEEVC
jgi:hypothetical protein